MLNLAAFSRKDLQNFVAILKYAMDNGINDASALHAIILTSLDVDKMKVQTIKSSTGVVRRGICPSCNSGIMMALPVNHSPSTRVGGKYTQVRICRNCRYEEWK